MIPSFLTAGFFALSAIFGNRSARILGGAEANFWRLTCATIFLAIWAFGFGSGWASVGFPIFFMSGLLGIGVGDSAYFQALPRLGSRLTVLVVNCLTAPFGALIEWLWLGTRLTTWEMLFGAIALVGIGVSLAPAKGDDGGLDYTKKGVSSGLLFGAAAALGGAFGAVLSRKAYELDRDIDGGTAAFQRITGGLIIGGICLLAVKWPFVKEHLTFSGEGKFMPSSHKYRSVWYWVVANSLAGQTLGVSCYQWAFATTPTGVVLPIVATTPLLMIPLAWWIDGERPSKRSILGGVVGVGGVAGLAIAKLNAK